MKIEINRDVIIIGGGPAGSTLATLLAKTGYSTVVFEATEFPREHIGEALIPSVVPILERIGVKDELEKRGFLKKRGTTFRWGEHQEPWTVHFAEGNPSANYSYQVYRAEFDQILTDNATGNGVDVRFKHKVLEPVMEGDRVVGVKVKDLKKNEIVTAIGRFVVDASGQASLFGEQFTKKIWDVDFRNIALSGYFSNAGRLEGVDANNTLVEGYSEGWFWAIPLHIGLLSVGTVMDASMDKDDFKRDRAAFLDAQIQKTSKLKELLKDAKLEGNLRVQRDWSYQHEKFYGLGFALLGDAACFIDPLFSTGVFLGMQHAEILAACVHSFLQGDIKESEALEFYEKEYKLEYMDLRNVCNAMYGGVAGARKTLFWKAREIQALPDSVSSRSSFVRLISGRERRGFEVNPLSKLDLPPVVSSSLCDFENQLRKRLPVLGDKNMSSNHARIMKETSLIENDHPFLNVKLVQNEKMELVRSLVIKSEKLELGFIARSPLNPRGISVSQEMALHILPLVDGNRTVKELLDNSECSKYNITNLTKEFANLFWYGVFEEAGVKGCREENMVVEH